MTTTAGEQLTVHPATRLEGRLQVPGDKSISHRYTLLGGLARGTTDISGLSPGADVASTMACLRGLGADITVVGPGAVRILGRGRSALREPAGPLDAGNSGTTMRLLAGVLAACPFATTLVGDASLSRRPMRRVIEPLEAMGARLESHDGHAPLHITGGALTGLTWRPAAPSAQVKSAILLAGLAATGRTTVDEPMATRDHSERAFPAFGLTVDRDGVRCSVAGGQHATAPDRPLEVPGDPSSAAVWAAAAAALPGSRVTIEGVCLNPLRIGFAEVLRRMGATVVIRQTGETGGEPVGTIEATHAGHGDASVAAGEVPSLIDELPVLAARAALGGSLTVSGASELRVKESDRISALVAGFRALGVDAEERPDGFVIAGTRRPTGGIVDAAHDHRLVMAFALVALGATGPTTIGGADVVAVSYPSFARDLGALLA